MHFVNGNKKYEFDITLRTEAEGGEYAVRVAVGRDGVGASSSHL